MFLFKFYNWSEMQISRSSVWKIFEFQIWLSFVFITDQFSKYNEIFVPSILIGLTPVTLFLFVVEAVSFVLLFLFVVFLKFDLLIH